jgi:glycosyltransferase involved in cell wall biosynthesis
MNRTSFLSAVLITQNSKINFQCLETLVGILSSAAQDFEILIVDNNLSDETQEFLEKSTRELPNIHVMCLSWASTDEIAFLAGVQQTIGDHILLLTDPLVDVPLLPKLLQSTAGIDAVYIQRGTGARDNADKNALVNRISRWLTGFDGNAPRLKLISRKVAEYIVGVRLPVFTYIPLPFGFKRLIVPVADIASGKKPFTQTIGDMMSMVTTRSSLPIRISSCLCLAAAAFSVLYSFYVVAIFLFKSEVAPGWTTLSLQLSSMFFLISMALFMIGEYVLAAQRHSNAFNAFQITKEFSSSSISHQEKLNLIVSSSSKLSFAPVPEAQGPGNARLSAAPVEFGAPPVSAPVAANESYDRQS